jgi:Flp pilus assembly protein TadB
VTLLVGALVAAGTWLLMPGSSRRRVPVTAGPARGLPVMDLAAVAVALGVAVVVGGVLGIALGLATGVVAHVGLPRLSTEDRKAAREAVLRQAPDALDCLAACLAAGAPLWSAMRVVGQAFGDPIAGVLTRAVERHDLGSPPVETFAEMLGDSPLARVGRILVRSSESGGALADSLIAAAERLREQRGAELEVKARAVGVKVVGPLTVCFLPAFVLLAVVPVVGSMAMELF